MHTDQFSDGRCNWVKTSVSLLYLKEGITEFSNDKATEFHTDVVKNVTSRTPQGYSVKCGSCTQKHVSKTKSKNKKTTTWSMNCTICSNWLEEILSHHRQFPCPDIAWTNTDPSLWSSDPWEIVKIFQPFGCQRHRSAEDCDAAGLLTLILDCNFFRKFISTPTLVQDIKEARNRCMHSNDLQMTDADMKKSLDLMVAFLEEPELKEYQSACDAAKKIKQLRDNPLVLSTMKELEPMALQNKMTEMEQNITILSDANKTLRDDMNSMNSKETIQTTNLEDYRSRLGDIGDELSRVTSSLQTFEKLQDPDISSKVTALAKRVERLESETVKANNILHKYHQTHMRKLEARMQDLESEVRELKEPTPEKKSNMEDLRGVLLDLYIKTFQRVPIYLLKPDWKHPVKDLYVRQKMELVHVRGKPEKSPNVDEQFSGRQNQHDKGNKSITKVSDILYKDGNMCKNVYITAEAGMGKSTLCEHLVRLWCDAHGASDNTHPTQDQDLQTMSKFQLLFYINLRDANKSLENPKYEIARLIHDQLELSSTDYSLDDIKKYLRNPCTLVLMDSLDELSSNMLPRRCLHNKSCIVTTSRPWKLETLRSQIESNVDQQIEIVGLTETSPKDLARNVVKILNTEFDQTKSSDEFIAEVKAKGLAEYLNIPMMIIQMLSLWYDGKSLGSSQFDIFCRIIHHQIITAINAKELPECPENSRRQTFPICCTDDNCSCLRYVDLLWKISKLAYHTLFGENREMCLVFDHNTTKVHELSPADVDICLKIGVLTQHKLFVKKLTVEKKSVSFIHKMNQEFFAAVFLSDSQQGSVKNQITAVIKDLDRALELDKVLLFCNKLNPNTARELSDQLSVKAGADKRVKEYRQSGDYDLAPNIELMYKIQNIISAAEQEGYKVASQPDTIQDAPSQQTIPITQTAVVKLKLDDMLISKPPQWCHITGEYHSVQVDDVDMADVKSLHIDAIKADDSMWKRLEEQTCSLETIVVKGSKDGIKVANIHGVVMRNKVTLRTLGLHGYCDSQLDQAPLGNKLTEMLSCHLTCLFLYEVELSHNQCEMFARHLSTTDNLRQLTLAWIKCPDHAWDRGECCVVEIQSKLEHAKLWWLPFQHLSFSTENLKSCEIDMFGNVPAAMSATSCLKSASNLRKFMYRDLQGTAVQELLDALPQLHSLETLVLREIDFGSLTEIQLSAMAATKIESMELRWSTITLECLENLVQSFQFRQVAIRLEGVSIRDGDPSAFLQQLRKSPNIDMTYDRGAKYNEDGGWRIDVFVFIKNNSLTPCVQQEQIHPRQ